jgi:hypothetical protein
VIRPFGELAACLLVVIVQADSSGFPRLAGYSLSALPPPRCRSVCALRMMMYCLDRGDRSRTKMGVWSPSKILVVLVGDGHPPAADSGSARSDLPQRLEPLPRIRCRRCSNLRNRGTIRSTSNRWLSLMGAYLDTEHGSGAAGAGRRRSGARHGPISRLAFPVGRGSGLAGDVGLECGLAVRIWIRTAILMTAFTFSGGSRGLDCANFGTSCVNYYSLGKKFVDAGRGIRKRAEWGRRRMAMAEGVMRKKGMI